MDLHVDTAGLRQAAIEAGRAGLPFIENLFQVGATAALTPYGFGAVPPLVLPGVFDLVNKALGLEPGATPDQTAAAIAADPAAAQAALAPIDAELARQKQADDTRIASQAQQTALIALDTTAQDRVQRWWRPAIAWGLGGLLMVGKALPFLIWFFLCFGLKLPDAPPIDDQTVLILTGLLGVTVAARSADKAVKASTVKAVTTAAVRR